MALTKLALTGLFLLITFSHFTQSTEARHLRRGNKRERSKLRSYTKISKTAFEDEPAPTLPSPTAPVSQSPPPGHVDGFRPTIPGHSPGIGHHAKARNLRHGNRKELSKLHFHTKPDINSTSKTTFEDEPAPVIHSSPPGHVDGLRSTAPGHSPGMGHSLHY